MTINIEVSDGVIQPCLVELKDGSYEAKVTNIDLRTARQNNALFLWLSQIAKRLNDDNITIEMILKPEVNWNKDKLKSMTFDPIVDHEFNKKSSTKLNKDEFSQVIDIMIKAFAYKGIDLPQFPSIEIKEK